MLLSVIYITHLKRDIRRVDDLQCIIGTISVISELYTLSSSDFNKRESCEQGTNIRYSGVLSSIKGLLSSIKGLLSTIKGVLSRLKVYCAVNDNLILDSEGNVLNITSQDVMFCLIRRRCILLVAHHCIERILEIFDVTKVV